MSASLTYKKGLIFDLDGTLVDTLADIATALNLTREALGLARLLDAEITCHVGNGTAHLVRQTIPLAPENFEAAHQLYLKQYDEHLLDESSLQDGAPGVLEHFRDRNLAVITNKPIAATLKILQGLEVLDLFSMVLGGDSLEKRKPDPFPLNHYMQSQGLSPADVVMIGDGVNDIRAGLAAGMMTVGLTCGVSSREELQAEGAGVVIDHMGELPRVIA